MDNARDPSEAGKTEGLSVDARIQRRRRQILFRWGIRWGIGALLIAYTLSKRPDLLVLVWVTIPFAFASLALQLYLLNRLETTMRALEEKTDSPRATDGPSRNA